jgi:serine/threonine-protein kinase
VFAVVDRQEHARGDHGAVMASGADPLVGKVLADRFEILERVGDGGTGVVYKARQLSVDRIIAVKVLGAHVSTDPQWMKRFHNEARAACKLEHPNTVRVLDFGQTREGLLFIAMEYLHGRSLRSEIERAGRLPGPRVLQIMAQICASLQEAHSQGIIHRDIKPDNIFLIDLKAGGDMVKVLDFSVAKLDAPDAQLTRAGVVFGTPSYMSPEQGRGVPLGPQSDLYAVGIVAYEMLMGRPPFEAAIPTEVVMMHLRNPPPPLQGVPGHVAALVMRCLEKDPKRRPSSAAELEALCNQHLVEHSGVMPQRVVTPAPMAAAPEPSSRQHPRTTALPSGGMPAAPSGRHPAAAPHMGGHPGGTMVLPESGLPPGTQGLPSGPSSTEWHREPSSSFRDEDTRDHANFGPRPAGPLFWLAWALLGLGGGLAAHFWIMHRAAGG